MNKTLDRLEVKPVLTSLYGAKNNRFFKNILLVDEDANVFYAREDSGGEKTVRTWSKKSFRK